ncbi:hypothetical protein [Spirosoma arcticum]
MKISYQNALSWIENVCRQLQEEIDKRDVSNSYNVNLREQIKFLYENQYKLQKHNQLIEIIKRLHTDKSQENWIASYRDDLIELLNSKLTAKEENDSSSDIVDFWEIQTLKSLTIMYNNIVESMIEEWDESGRLGSIGSQKYL